MTPPVLVAYATKHGSTREVAQAVCDTFEAAGVQAHLRPASEVRNLAGYAAVVVGAPIYMGRWHPHAHRFLSRHRRALAGMPLAVFALGPVVPGPVGFPEARAQLDAALAKHPVVPVSIALFGGRIEPAGLRFPLSRMQAADSRDWDEIREWAASLVRGTPEPSGAGYPERGIPVATPHGR